MKSDLIRNIGINIVLLLLFVGFPHPALGQSDADNQNRILPGLDVIILVDESETMWNKTDTEGIRVNTVNFFIDVLAAETSTTGHRVGIIPFGTEPQVIPFTLVDSPEAADTLKTRFEAVHQQFEAIGDVQYTDINLALNAALTLLNEEGDPTRKPAIILISDGQPTNSQVDEEKGQDIVEEYLVETRDLLAEFDQYESTVEVCGNVSGVPLFTIGMGVDKLVEASSPEFITLYREFWQGVASRNNGYYREAAKLQEMQGISTYIFSELLCTPATPPLALRSTQVLDYQVFDSYYQIIFTISGKENPDLVAQIYRPQADGSAGGELLTPEDEGVSWQSGPDYEVWRATFTEPWVGNWQVTLEGEGQAEFSYLVFPNVTLDIEQPHSGFVPVDQPLNLRANIIDEQGQPVDVPVQSIQVEIEGENIRRQVPLAKDGLTYTASLDALGETGEYSLIFSTILPNGTPIFEHKWVTLISAPWVDVVSPLDGQENLPGDDLPIEAAVHLAGAIPLDGIRLTATLSKDGEPVETVEMGRDDVTTSTTDQNVVTYNGNFTPIDEVGDYTVQTKLVAILPGGRVFDNQSSPLVFQVVLSPTPTPTITPSPTSSPTSTATSTPSPTASPTSTPIEVAQVVPTDTPSPTPSPSPTSTPTPTPSMWETVTDLPSSNYFLPCFSFLLLLLLLLMLWLLWRRRHPDIPDNITLLATLMHSRKESKEPPYVLVLGSGASMMLGSKTMRQVVKAVAQTTDLDEFHRTLDGFSPQERYALLKKHFDEVGPSIGYARLADLVKQGYLQIMFTTNLDRFLETQLQANLVAYQTIVCNTQTSLEALTTLENVDPPVKLMKLHGDVEARDFAFTPSEISQVGSKNERILREYMNRDLIVIGPGPRDYDLNRAIDREGGAIWFVNEAPLPAEAPLVRSLRERSAENNYIDGEFGQFDRFFVALHQALSKLS